MRTMGKAPQIRGVLAPVNDGECRFFGRVMIGWLPGRIPQKVSKSMLPLLCAWSMMSAGLESIVAD